MALLLNRLSNIASIVKAERLAEFPQGKNQNFL